MPWELDHTDKESVYWRRSEDGFVIGFNRPGVGEPSSTEDAPPPDIDKYAPPILTSAAPSAEPRLITQLAFWRRVPDAVAVALEMASLDNPNDAIEARTLAASIRVGMKKLSAARYINLDDDELKAKLGAFVGLGILKDEQLQAILTAPITEDEKP